MEEDKLLTAVADLADDHGRKIENLQNRVTELENRGGVSSEFGRIDGMTRVMLIALVASFILPAVASIISAWRSE